MATSQDNLQSNKPSYGGVAIDMWEVDLMEKFPKLRNIFEYLIVEVEYFSKWIEAKPLVNQTEKNTLNFLY